MEKEKKIQEKIRVAREEVVKGEAHLLDVPSLSLIKRF